MFGRFYRLGSIWIDLGGEVGFIELEREFLGEYINIFGLSIISSFVLFKFFIIFL